MICSRFHSLILSYLLKQKLYILSYSDKIINVINDLNLIDSYHTFDELSELEFIKLDDFNYKNFVNEYIKSIKAELIDFAP